MLRASLMILLACVGVGCAGPAAAPAPPARPRPALRVVVPDSPAEAPPPSSPSSPAPSPGGRDAAEESMLVFVASPSCASLERTTVPAAGPADAVRMILRSESLARLPLAEPDVRVASGVARIDLTLPHGSKRSLRALSRCEKVALLGAITRTLKGNPRWGIRQVFYTERGDLLAIES